MIYVGIDPGRRTGWAVIDGEGCRIDSGYWDTPGPDWQGRWRGEIDTRIMWLDAVKRRPYRVGFEHVTFHKGKAWAEIYYGQKALLLSIVPKTVLVTPAKVKATGGSRVKYGLMHNALERWELGEDYPIDDNEADALWIAETVRLMDVEE